MGLFFLQAIDHYLKDYPMAKKPNYGYEKRQKELARKAKKDEKKKQKLEDESPENPAQD